jgi:hypothetical protein
MMFWERCLVTFSVLFRRFRVQYQGGKGESAKKRCNHREFAQTNFIFGIVMFINVG